MKWIMWQKDPSVRTKKGDFKSSTIHTVFEHPDSLKLCSENIREDQSLDSMSIQKLTACWQRWAMWTFFSFYLFSTLPLMYADILYSLLQKRIVDSLKTRQTLETFPAPQLNWRITWPQMIPRHIQTSRHSCCFSRMWQSVNVLN